MELCNGRPGKGIGSFSGTTKATSTPVANLEPVGTGLLLLGRHAQSLRDSPVRCFCLSIYCVTGKVSLILQALGLASHSEVLNSTGF